MATSTLADGFRSPQPAYSPNPLWWWSGDRLDEERLKWQLERFREGGVFNLTVICLAPAGPLYGHFADDPPFMSAEWWRIFRAVCDHAGTLGMHIWFYDQIGFSGANFQGQVINRRPQHVGMTIERVTLEAHGPASLVPPPGSIPLLASVRGLDGEGQASGPSRRVTPGDLADWRESSPVRLALTCARPAGFDYFSAAACADLFAAIHGEFERHVGDLFGTVIPGTFQDELPPLPRWGSTFAETFQQVHGYDIIPRLDALWDDEPGSNQVRHDYHATRAQLAEEAFFRPLFEWHRDRQMIIGVDQQNPARAGDPIGTVEIYADYMRTHRWFSAPGSDHHGEAKLHSSLAHLYDHPRVWIESFHSSGWDGTLEETFDWLVPWLRGGANLYNPHATYYSTRGGWFEWAPPSTDWRQPYWRHYAVFANAVSRLCWLLTRGDHACDVALLFPTSTVQAGTGLDGQTTQDAQAAHDLYLRLVGRMVWFAATPGAFDEAGVDYDILDDASIERATVIDGGLEVGGERYRTVVLPACTNLEPTTVVRLLEFAEAGGVILAIGGLPEHLLGSGDDATLSALRERITLIEETDLASHLRDESPLVQANVPTMVCRVEGSTIVFVPGTFPMASRVEGWPRATIDFDRERYPQDQTVVVRGVAGVPERWDPFTGESHPLPASCVAPQANGVEVRVPFDGRPCMVLVWPDPPGTANPAVAETVVSDQPLATDWDVFFAQTLDNRWGDFTWPPDTATLPVAQWTLHDEEGHRVYATFGPRGRWRGPRPVAELAADASPGDWQTASWSLSRGIHRDPLHRNSLGPAGHVPEEFVDFGVVEPGESVHFQTTFALAAPMSGWLVIGSPGALDLSIDGEPMAIPLEEEDRYQRAIPVTLGPGTHVLDAMLTAERSGRLRLSLGIVTDLAAMRRPERLTVDRATVMGASATFVTTIDVAIPVRDATIQVATRGPATIFVDGQPLGRQGGYLPYGDGSATHRYDLAPALAQPGPHTLAVEVGVVERGPYLAVDGIITMVDGTEYWIQTDQSWTVSVDGQVVTCRIDGAAYGDPAMLHLRQRPHPLPGASWLEGDAAAPASSLQIGWDDGGLPGVITLITPVPPGANQVTVPLATTGTAFLDDVPIGEHLAPTTDPWTMDLPNPDAVARDLRLIIAEAPGFRRGAVLTGPLTYRAGPGRMSLVPWATVGLGDAAGVMTYTQRVTLPPVAHNQRVMLDLGDLRGSVDITVDATPVAILVTAPFQADLTPWAGQSVALRIALASSLGSYMQATSPTPFAPDEDHRVGLFGPVRLFLTQHA